MLEITQGLIATLIARIEQCTNLRILVVVDRIMTAVYKTLYYVNSMELSKNCLTIYEQNFVNIPCFFLNNDSFLTSQGSIYVIIME